MAKQRRKEADDRDPVMVRAKDLFEQSGLTLEQLAERMGYTGDTGRQSVWQFLNRTKDPRLRMLRRFSRALGVELQTVITPQAARRG
jgi:transcriptional regulator with XRE-family HTH domain